MSLVFHHSTEELLSKLQGISKSDTSEVFKALRDSEGLAEQLNVQAKIAILRNFSIETIEPYLRLQVLASGIAPTISIGSYNAMAQELIAPNGHCAGAEVVVLATTLDELDARHVLPGWTADNVLRDLESLHALALSRVQGVVVVNTLPMPLYDPKGIGAVSDDLDYCWQIERINRFVVDSVRKNPGRLVLADWRRLLTINGDASSIDARNYYVARAPFKASFLSAYAGEIAKVVRALKGRAKKCLVLDCDNTLWGGVLGEDGLDGIQLEPKEYPGRAYYDFQADVLRLAKRGVIITLCSRNNEQDVLEALDRHPHMLIRREHISGLRINWRQKCENIRELAEELNIGLDSFVFVDDDAVECELVRAAIPEVTMLAVPQKLYKLPELLSSAGLFDTLSTSKEDLQRASLYRTEMQRKQASSSSLNVDDFLKSLNLIAIIQRAKPADLPRISQLTQKTNQFNLTTRRYSEADLRALSEDPSALIFSLHLSDKFGEHGLTGVAIVRRRGKESAEVDSLLLSCRILNRKVELAFVDRFLTEVESLWKSTTLNALYIPTKKNQQVVQFWDHFGFNPTAGEDGTKVYSVKSSERRRYDIPFIQIEAS